MRQRTLRNSIKATGVSLHKGEKVHLVAASLRRSIAGIVFRRADLDPVLVLPARLRGERRGYHALHQPGGAGY